MEHALRPRPVGEILDAAFGLYKQHFATLAGIGLALYLPLIVLLWLAPWVATLTSMALVPLHGAALIFALAGAVWGRPLSTGDALKRALRRYPALFFLWLLYAVARVFAATLFLIPLIILVPVLFAWKHVFLLEPGSPLVRRTMRLSDGAFGKALAVVFIAWLISTMPGMALGVSNLLTNEDMGGFQGDDAVVFSATSLAFQSLGYLLQALMVPYLYAATTMLYVDQRARKDGVGADMAAERLERALEG